MYRDQSTLGDRGLSIARCDQCDARHECAFFQLPEESLGRLQSMTQLMSFGPGVTIIEQGEPASGFFIVRRGSVRLIHTTPTKKVLLETLGPPALVGLTEVIEHSPYMLAAESEGTCQLEFVPRQLFVPFLVEEPGVALELLIGLSERLNRLVARFLAASSREPLRQQVLTAIRERARRAAKSPGSRMRPMSITVQELAESVGCSRQWASAILKQLVQQGVIRRSGRRITLVQEAERQRAH